MSDARVQALRAASAEFEHRAEFNAGITVRWSPARQAANNRLISQSRELSDRADALEKELVVRECSECGAPANPELGKLLCTRCYVAYKT